MFNCFENLIENFSTLKDVFAHFIVHRNLQFNKLAKGWLWYSSQCLSRNYLLEYTLCVHVLKYMHGYKMFYALRKMANNNVCIIEFKPSAHSIANIQSLFGIQTFVIRIYLFIYSRLYAHIVFQNIKEEFLNVNLPFRKCKL